MFRVDKHTINFKFPVDLNEFNCNKDNNPTNPNAEFQI